MQNYLIDTYSLVGHYLLLVAFLQSLLVGLVFVFSRSLSKANASGAGALDSRRGYFLTLFIAMLLAAAVPLFSMGLAFYAYVASYLAPLALSLVFFAVLSLINNAGIKGRSLPKNDIAVFFLGLVVFYASTLGLLDFDFYALGYSAKTALVCALALHLYGAWRKSTSVMLFALTAILFFALGVNGSENFFDLLLSPLWLLILPYLYFANKRSTKSSANVR